MTPDIDQAQQEIIQEFEFFDDWQDRYQYLIDLGRKLEPLPEQAKCEANRVHGCQSQVWLLVEGNAAQLKLQATSDSAIVCGLIALLLRVYSHRSAQQIVALEPHFIERIGLASHLSPTRSNGLHAMLKTIRARAERFLQQPA